MDFKEYCERLRELYETHGFALKLHVAATDAALHLAEAKLRFALGEEMRAVWRHSDGGERWRPVFMRPGYLSGYDFLPIAEALSARDRMRDRSPQYQSYADPEPRDRRIRPGWFQEGWLPFADLNGQSLLLIQDYSPSPLGDRGQIIAFTHDPDAIDYVAPSLSAFLSDSLAAAHADVEDFFIGLADRGGS